MKKIICAALAVFTVLSVLSGCGGAENGEKTKISVVTTVFPEYDWVNNIIGDKTDSIDLNLLLDSGVDLHSYQPTADDIIKISECDLFIYVGGESDKWVEKALKEALNKDMQVINLIDVLGTSAKEEEIKEGMKAAEEEEENEEPEYDEHVWLSLKNTALFVSKIKDALIKLDGKNADTYKENADKYTEKLNALDKKYEETVKAAKIKTLLFGDRFPFRYLTDDYGLDYYAAFSGCSAESEADFETVTFLAKKLDELNLPAVITLEGTNHKIAQTVISASKNKSAKILIMDSMQSATLKDVKSGTTYLSIMEKNLGVLSDALR